jgi:hypothetical protein
MTGVFQLVAARLAIVPPLMRAKAASRPAPCHPVLVLAACPCLACVRIVLQTFWWTIVDKGVP